MVIDTSAIVAILLAEPEAEIEVVPFALRDARAARRAFGKGRHPAALHFGDCASYASAKETGEPLLYKGEDFKRTDIASALDF